MKIGKRHILQLIGMKSLPCFDGKSLLSRQQMKKSKEQHETSVLLAGEEKWILLLLSSIEALILKITQVFVALENVLWH